MTLAAVGGVSSEPRRAPEPSGRVAVCRSCGAELGEPVLSLGNQPLANALRGPGELGDPEPRYPLDLALCGGCSLLQLTEAVPPEQLFSDYPYFSSVIADLVEHARALARRMIDERALGPESLVVELASNDG